MRTSPEAGIKGMGELLALHVPPKRTEAKDAASRQQRRSGPRCNAFYRLVTRTLRQSASALWWMEARRGLGDLIRIRNACERS